MSQCFERHQFRWRLSRVRKCKWDLPVIHISLVNVTAITNLNDRCIILLLSIVSGWWWQFLRRSRDFTSGLTPREYCSPYSHWVGAITLYVQTSKAQKPEHANGFISSTLISQLKSIPVLNDLFTVSTSSALRSLEEMQNGTNEGKKENELGSEKLR